MVQRWEKVISVSAGAKPTMKRGRMAAVKATLNHGEMIDYVQQYTQTIIRIRLMGAS